MDVERYDLIVVGGGSGGIGAALAGARLGLAVLLLERADTLGGTAVQGGVHCWEMGAGGTGLPFDIFRRLKRIPRAAGIYDYGRHMSWWDPDREPVRYPGGERIIAPQRRYIDTLQRHGAPDLRPTEEFCRRVWHGVPFEPVPYEKTVRGLLDETGRCCVRTGMGFDSADVDSGWVKSLRLSDGTRATASAYVDATGGARLARACGAVALSGQEARHEYGEPSAPEQRADQRNGATLVYRVTPTSQSEVEPLPPGVSSECWWRDSFPVASCNHYPCGDLNVNMLPTMEGRELARLDPAAAYAECTRRARAHWHHAQSIFPEFRGFRLSWIAPSLGVRESHRVLCEHMLTEQEIRGGYARQDHGQIIAIADHALDTHGRSTGRQGCSELATPYGVPFGCLMPRGFANLLVACRGAGFTSLAASSCRLSRTMMQLGQAAGTAAAVAAGDHVAPAHVSREGLREALRAQHAQVEWPTPPELHDHLLDEDAP